MTNPRLICQVLGESSYAKLLIVSNIAAPTNGANTLPVPDNIVINTNSPEVVQYDISGSICPTVIAVSPPAKPANTADIT